MSRFRLAGGCILGVLLTPWVTSCQLAQYRVSVVPSLRPVDPARPMVVFSQIRSEACGRDAVAGAIRQMKRLAGVDGYLEVVVEDTGSGRARCAIVTEYPFLYADNPGLPGLQEGSKESDAAVVPGRATHQAWVKDRCQ